MKKISIIGATVLGNRGAEAMLTTTIGRIREQHADAQFYVYSYYPQEDKNLVTDKSITIHSATPLYLVTILFPAALLLWLITNLRLKSVKSILPQSVQDLADSDLLIDLAGVSFMDGRTVFLPYNIMTIWPALLVYTPVVKFSQGMGSFRQLATKISAKIFLPRCKQLFARGEITHQFLEDFFSQEHNYQSAGDVAFSHKQGDSISSENRQYSNEVQKQLASLKNSNKAVVGLCPSSVVYSKSQKSGIDYIGTLVQMVEKLLEDRTIYLFLFPNATRERHMDKLRNNDLLVIQKIVDALVKNGVSSERFIYITKDINTDSIKTMIDSCDITVVSRFHAMIASLSLAKPVMVLGWSHKYLEVMKQFNMQNYVIDYQDQEIDLVKNVQKMLEEKSILKAQIIQNLPEVKKESFMQFNYLFKELLR